MAHQVRARVVICGAGVIGAAVAYYLSLRGVAATVIERCGVACAASGKAGGFLALDWCDSSSLASLARKSFQLHAELAQTLGADYGYRRLTTLAVATGAHGLKGSHKVARRYRRDCHGSVVGICYPMAAAPARVGSEGSQHHLAARRPDPCSGAVRGLCHRDW